MPLCFTRLTVYDVRIPMRMSFSHALKTRNEAHNLLLALETDTGHIGYGEILPREYLTGETLETAWDDVCTRWWPRLKELSFDDRVPEGPAAYAKAEGEKRGLIPGTAQRFFQTLRPLYEEADQERKTASYAGIDLAAFDAWARATRRPGCYLFGAAPAAAPLTAVIGGGSVKTARRLAWAFRLLGFQRFKLKVGQENDLERLQAVRQVIGATRRLCVDANAAWDEETAVQTLRAFAPYNLDAVEQPLPAGDACALARVQAEGGVSVMADESLCTTADAGALLAANGAKRWNVRLGKIGGVSGLLRMIDLATPHGIDLHFGVLVGETSLLAAAQRACLGLASFVQVEYGFPRLLLKGDPFRGGPGGYFGAAHPLGDAPGFGVRLLPSALEGVTLRREVLT